MIHRFEDLKKIYTGPMSFRYVGAGTAADAEIDGPDESDPRDEFLASSARDEIMQVLETEPGLPAPDPTPADEAPPATEPNPYIEFDLAPGDIAKLQDSGVRPKDAVDAGFTRVTSSEAAFHLKRGDTGDLEGILVPYPLVAPGISHCRVILDTPVRLKTSKGKLVPRAPARRVHQLALLCPRQHSHRSGRQQCAGCVLRLGVVRVGRSPVQESRPTADSPGRHRWRVGLAKIEGV
jgi:hypothetical protein